MQVVYVKNVQKVYIIRFYTVPRLLYITNCNISEPFMCYNFVNTRNFHLFFKKRGRLLYNIVRKRLQIGYF